MNFKMKPFPCPECGHFLLVDGIIEEGENDDARTFTVRRVLDDTTLTDPELRQFERNAELRAMGRFRLYSELLNARRQARALSERLESRRWLRR